MPSICDILVQVIVNLVCQVKHENFVLVLGIVCSQLTAKSCVGMTNTRKPHHRFTATLRLFYGLEIPEVEHVDSSSRVPVSSISSQKPFDVDMPLNSSG